MKKKNSIGSNSEIPKVFITFTATCLAQVAAVSGPTIGTISQLPPGYSPRYNQCSVYSDFLEI